ncbi:MAG TPA: MFS transporter [Polyangiaceae bacterium]|nr:MFS transporter [Polyangiaceae bacterium]
MSQDGRRRNLVWGVTWLAYATYYLGRKGFSSSKAELENAGLLSIAAMGVIDSLYLAAYSLGQFANGTLGDRIGARRLVGYGLLATGALCAVFGSVSSAVLFAVLWGLNGLAQASGWPGTTRAMAEWTTPANRGTVMGFWSTCYQVGPFLAGPLLGVLIARFGWRAAFHVPAIILLLVALLVLLLVTRGPRPLPSATSQEEDEPELVRQAQRAVVRNPLLWCYGMSYFFIKFTRYALQLWLPFYLQKQVGYAVDVANTVASAFEGGGFLGVIAIGTLSDRLGRVALSALSLVGLSLALLGATLFVGHTTWVNVIILALIGACLFAPDSILCGAAAQDAGGAHAVSMATGFVNGVGSIGALLVGLTLPAFAKSHGWHTLWPLLVGTGLLAALCLLPVLWLSRPAAT